ncbi:hypothetical protein NUM3379_06270 [Kineococcus sp. NUM-3379]
MRTSAAERASGLGRALLAGAVVAAGCGGVLALLALAGREPALWRRLLPAALCAALTLAAVAWLRRLDRGGMRALGTTGPGALRGLAVGAAVVLLAAVPVLVPAGAAGLVRWEVAGRAEVAALAGAVLVAALAVVLPAEVALRGYALTSLRERGAGAAWAAVLVTSVWVLVPTAAVVVGGALVRATGRPGSLADVGGVALTGSLTGVLSGPEPVAAAVLTTAAGLALAAAREATAARSVWTCAGAHLVLVVLLLGVGTGRTGSGAVRPALLVLVLALAAAVFLLLRRRAAGAPPRRRRAPRPSAPVALEQVR